MLPITTRLKFAPTGDYFGATILELTPKLIDEQLHRDWWRDKNLIHPLLPPPIDRNWDWNKLNIEYDGRILGNKKFAISTPDGAIQGAMMISTEAVPSRLNSRDSVLFLEMLFTAPRNRVVLRIDGKPFWIGVGLELLTWAAWLSREQGHDGRLTLDASPDSVEWYTKRGLKKLGERSMVFEGVPYLPMELSATAAIDLLADWPLSERA